jgi:RNA polymerase sigma-70 factor (ECF subfamily)
MPRESPRPSLEIERYRPLLRAMAWQMHLDRRLQRRFDGSDVVQECMLRASEKLDQFRGGTEAELIRWLQEILNNTFRDMVSREFAQRRTPEMEASLEAVVEQSSARWDSFLAAREASPCGRHQLRSFFPDYT